MCLRDPCTAACSVCCPGDVNQPEMDGRGQRAIILSLPIQAFLLLWLSSFPARPNSPWNINKLRPSIPELPTTSLPNSLAPLQHPNSQRPPVPEKMHRGRGGRGGWRGRGSDRGRARPSDSRRGGSSARPRGVCHHFLAGRCTYGATCRYSHDVSATDRDVPSDEESSTSNTAAIRGDYIDFKRQLR